MLVQILKTRPNTHNFPRYCSFGTRDRGMSLYTVRFEDSS